MTSYNELWNQVLHAIQESHYFKDDIFHTWIENKTSLFNIDNQTAYVSFKTMITHQLLSQENNKQLFESTLSELYGEDLSFNILITKKPISLCHLFRFRKRQKRLHKVL